LPDLCASCKSDTYQQAIDQQVDPYHNNQAGRERLSTLFVLANLLGDLFDAKHGHNTKGKADDQAHRRPLVHDFWKHLTGNGRKDNSSGEMLKVALHLRAWWPECSNDPAQHDRNNWQQDKPEYVLECAWHHHLLLRQ